MRKFIIGFIVGVVLTASVAYAASRKTLVSGSSGVELSTSANPVYVTIQ